MNTDQLVSTLTHVVLLPPVCLLLGAVAGMLIGLRRPRAGRALTGVSLALLLVLSTEAGARLLMHPLENLARPLDLAHTHGAGAIVVLAAGRLEFAPEYDGQDIPDLTALARLRYGAYLQHRTGLPLLVTGGNASPDGLHEPKARSMARVLRQDFRTPVAWIEEASATTAENATFSARILQGQRIERILLVTDALHMARAERAFARSGLRVVAAPTMFYGAGPLMPLHFVPSASALQNSYYASYELAGLAWYRLREALGRN
jgi:uncharacterized SAM-binding protein YcdF (DUF218 family)